MNPQDPLASLHPLREPALVGWWPPAPGWWILAGLVLLALLVLAWLLLRRYRANAYRRRALARLARLQAAYRENSDSRALMAEINALLKAVALRAYPRRDIAASSGESWLAFLESTTSRQLSFPTGFATAAYRSDCPETDPEQALVAARAWIQGHRQTS